MLNLIDRAPASGAPPRGLALPPEIERVFRAFRCVASAVPWERNKEAKAAVEGGGVEA